MAGRVYTTEHKRFMQQIGIDLALIKQRFENAVGWYSSVPLPGHLDIAQEQLDLMQEKLDLVKEMHTKRFPGELSKVDDERR